MEAQDFWNDFAETVGSSVPWIVALWALAPALLIALFALRGRPQAQQPEGELVYSIYQDERGVLRLHRHGLWDEHEPALLLIAPPSRDGPQEPYRSG